MALENSSKLPKLPVIATGNDLTTGDVVYLASGGWSRSFGDALVAVDENTARVLEADLLAAAHEVVGGYLVTVARNPNGAPAPAHYREAIRRAGPTIAYGAAA